MPAMAGRNDGRLEIGEVLRSTRARLDRDIYTAERETKIGRKYLEALENEDWDVLPAPAYVKGYLRTYAGYLGLDADALVDEYRRTIERSPAAEQPYLFSEPLLERRHRPIEAPRRSWGQVLAIIGVLVLAVAAIVAVVRVDPLNWFGNGAGAHHGKASAKGHHHASAGHKHGGGNGGGSPGKAVSLVLITHDEMVVCLLPGNGRPFIDSQTLVAGSKEGPFEPPAENYRLDLISGGKATVVLGGKAHRVESRRPASYRIDAGGITEIPFKGQKCQ
jgi:cytoskeleton protein RodZ